MKFKQSVNPFLLYFIHNSLIFLGLSLVYLVRLQTLRIDSNKLSMIRSDEVLKLVQLKILDISDCSIENVDVKIKFNLF